MAPPIDPTPISDYAHWNEDAFHMWYQEVGRFAGDQNEPDDLDPFDSWNDYEGPDYDEEE